MNRDLTKSANFDAIRLRLASPETIRAWSFGEVNKPETINYRTQKPETGGLFAEEIFGPTKDWECYCGKYKKIRYKGIVCDKCGVEVTTSLVRRERMGHIELSAPVAHIWFLRSVPSKVGLILDVPVQALEKVIYFAAFIISHVDEEGKHKASDQMRQEYKSKKKQIEHETEIEIKKANDQKLGAEFLEKIQQETDRKQQALEQDFLAADKELKELQVLKILSENRYQELSLRFGHLFEAGIGAEAVYNLLERINIPDTIKQILDEQLTSKGAKLERLTRRHKLLNSLNINKIRPEWTILKCIPVIPPDLRPMVALDGGRFATSDLNDLYRRVINRNNRLRRLLDLDAPEVICRNEKRMLQEAVDALIDNNARHAKTVLAATGQKRQLRPLVCTAFNADFDGDQMAVHLPLTAEARWEAENLMAAEKNLLKPATGQPVITPKQDIALGCFYLTNYHSSDTAPVKKFFSSVKDAKLAYKCRVVTLHERIKVRFTETEMNKFPEGTNHLVETSLGRILFNEILPDKVAYYNEVITVKKMAEAISFCLEIYGQETTAHFLDELKNLGYRYVTKSGYSLGIADFPKVEEKDSLIKIADKQILEVEEQYQEGLLTQAERHAKILEVWTSTKDKVVANNQKNVDKNGSVYAMIESGARGTWGQLGQVIGMKGLVVSPSGDIIELPVKGNFKEGFDVLEYFISSHGTRKGLSDTALRTANAGYLTRRLVDVSQDVVILEEDCGDTTGEVFTVAQSKEMGEKLADRVWGRYVISDVKVGDNMIVKAGGIIDNKTARAIDAAGINEVHVHSVLQCKLPKGFCRKCYGFDLAHNKPVEFGTAVGIIAAQSLGEPGTQLTLRTFHSGGVAGVDITQGLPRIEELFECRPPKRKAVLYEVDGKVEIEDADGKIVTSPTGKKIFEGRRGQKILKVHFEGMEETKIKFDSGDEVMVKDGDQVAPEQVILVRGSSGEEVTAKYQTTVKLGKNNMILSYNGPKTREYIIPLGFKLFVKEGEMVEKGQQMTDGSINLQELFELKGRPAVQRYILQEVQNIYSSQGQKVNDKHVELLICQMFSRVQVEEAGETELLPGEVVEKAQYMYANATAKKNGTKPSVAKELLFGVSRVALSTQSFLSSASFQETAKVLINTALTGKIDFLEGLKENVIIGRLIPAGTGFKKEVVVAK